MQVSGISSTCCASWPMKAHLRICALFRVSYSNLKRVVVLSLSYCCLIVVQLSIGQLLDNDWTTIGQGVEVRGRCGGGEGEVDDDKERPRPKAQPFFCM